MARNVSQPPRVRLHPCLNIRVVSNRIWKQEQLTHSGLLSPINGASFIH
jgi:hypothetical protein